jgi:hypothetical protein
MIDKMNFKTVIMNILLTPEIRATMPKSVVVVADFGTIDVIFSAVDPKEEPLILTGNNVVIEGETDDIIKWLKPFNSIAVGVGGSPQFEQFEIMHIKDEL